MGEHRGKTLDRLLRSGPLNADETAELFDAMLDALDRIHRGGGVHGAITPEKIVVLADRPPELLDADAEEQRAFLDGPFAAPELAAGHGHADAASDIYALAAVLYSAVAGTPPTRKADAVASMSRLQPSGFAPTLIEAIDAGLAPDPRERPRSVQAWRAMWRADAPTARPDDDRHEASEPESRTGPAVSSTTGPAALATDPPQSGGVGPAVAVGVVAGVLWLVPLLTANLYAATDPASYWAVSDAIWNSDMPIFVVGVLDLAYILLPVMLAGALLPVALAAGGMRMTPAGVALNAAAWFLAPVVNEVVLQTGWFAGDADGGGIPADLLVADAAIGLVGGAGLALAAGLAARRFSATPLVVGPLVWLLAMSVASLLASVALVDVGDVGWALLHSAIFALFAALAAVSTAALQHTER